MIKADARYDCEIRIDNIDRIEPTTQSNLKHLNIHLCSRKIQRAPGGHLEIGEADVAACRLDRIKRRQQILIADWRAIHAYPFIEADEMWGGVGSNAKTACQQTDDSTATTLPLPLVPATVSVGWAREQMHGSRYGRDALQTEINFYRML
ncbi:MAG: hypothetical protein CM15mP84_09050 [Cellvibrionales bacterium]|nr:MAG: hypothetical protein CM15mP84_09050 [Cellvibrionales bacterium]